MCEQVKIEYAYQCVHGQDKGFLLAVRKVAGEQTPEFAEYHRRHDLEVELRDLRRSVALQRAIARNNPDADPVVSASCEEYYR